MLTVAIASS